MVDTPWCAGHQREVLVVRRQATIAAASRGPGARPGGDATRRDPHGASRRSATRRARSPASGAVVRAARGGRGRTPAGSRRGAPGRRRSRRGPADEGVAADVAAAAAATAVAARLATSAVDCAHPIRPGTGPRASRSTSSSYTSDSKVPDISALDSPQQTKPSAKPVNVCQIIQRREARGVDRGREDQQAPPVEGVGPGARRNLEDERRQRPDDEEQRDLRGADAVVGEEQRVDAVERDQVA